MSLGLLLTSNQAMASLSYLQPYLDTIYAKAESVDVPTPVLDALVTQFHGIHTLHLSLRLHAYFF